MRNRNRKPLLLMFAVLVLILGACGLAAAAPEPLTSASPATGAIQLDGKLDEPAWSHTVTASGLTLLGTKEPALRFTTFRFLYTADALFVGIECQTVTDGKRLMVKPSVKQHDGQVFQDESIELYLQPDATGPYYQLAVNSAGVRYDGKGFDSTWNGDWSARTAESERGFQMEIRIPWKTLGVASAPKPGDEWKFNVCRNDRTYQQYETWANLVRGFHEPENFAALRFAGSSVGASPCEVSRRGTDVAVGLTGTNGAGAAQAVKADFTVQTPNGRFDHETVLDLQPQATGTFSFDAVKAWVAKTTVSVAYSLHAGTELLYESPAVTIPAERIRPARPDHPVPITIQNDSVALTFDKVTGNLLSAANKQSGLKAIFGDAGTPLLEMDTVLYIQHPRFFRPEDVQTIVPGFETLQNVTRHDTPEGETLEINHLIQPDIHVRLSITVPKSGVETQWNISLDNKLTVHPSLAKVVHRVRYPLFTDVSPTACGSAPGVILPTLMGQRYDDPGTTLVNRRPVSYLGRASMGWFDFFGASGGLYFKDGDLDPLPETELIAHSDPRTHLLTLGIERWSLAWPGDKWQPGPVGLGLHAGDWHKAADLYRTWFRKNFKEYTPPKWLKDADGYVMTGVPNYEFADLPRVIANAKAIGLNYVQLWSEMTQGDITYYAFGFPNPYMGTQQELTKAVADLHKEGGHIGCYLNFNTGDPLMGTTVRQPRLSQKMPQDVQRPALDYMKDNWIQQSMMAPDGSYSTWNTIVPGYLDGYWNTCPAAKKWTDYYYHWVIDKWAKQYGIDVWYLDSCPVSRGTPCYAFDHGHTRPAAEGQAIIDFYKRLRAGAPKGFGIMQEYNSDRLLPYSTHALGLPWHADHADPAVLRYTLPEYILFSGMCDGISGLSQFYPGETITNKDAIEFVFLIGNRYEFQISNRPPDMIDEWEKKMVDLRRACRPEMNYGDFLDNIGLGPLPDNVYAKLFRRADHGRLVVTLLDRRKENRTPLQVTVDLSAAGVGAVKNVTLQTLDGPKLLPAPERQGTRIWITVPVFPDRTAALLIETEMR